MASMDIKNTRKAHENDGERGGCTTRCKIYFRFKPTLPYMKVTPEFAPEEEKGLQFVIAYTYQPGFTLQHDSQLN